MDPRTSTVGDVLRRSAGRYPNRVALRFRDARGDERVWTYRELDCAVNAVAARLLNSGLVHGDRVAACGGNSDAYLIGFLACARVGLVHVPVRPDLSRGQVRRLLEDSDSTALLLDVAQHEGESGRELEVPPEVTVLALRGAQDSLLATAARGQPEAAADVLSAQVSGADLVQLRWVEEEKARPNGSSRRARAAMLTHSALLHGYLSATIALDLDGSDDPLHAMPLQYGPQLHTFLLPYLMLGASNRLLESPDTAAILGFLERERRGTLFAPSTTWVALANDPDFDTRELSSLRRAYSGNAAIPDRVLERLRHTLPLTNFYRCFGRCELASLAAVLGPRECDQYPGSAGRPVLFVEMRVVGSDGVDVAPGQVGELVYRSPQLSTGYWGSPGDTATSFRDGWFRSGERARIDADGFCYPVEEIKDVINSSGLPREEFA